jgi:XTP/dITP diphosphohydrolase
LTVRLLLATRNTGKLVELRRILAVAAPEVALVGLDDVPTFAEVPETGATFAENALLKARAAVAATGLPSVADDSGLAVDALNGMPGVLSARWSGRSGPDKDEENNRLLLAQLCEVPAERRGAAFVCAAALVLPAGGPVDERPVGGPVDERPVGGPVDEREHVVEATMTGSLLREPRGDGGFGYDPLFVPAGHQLSTAEMSAMEKDALSHRGKAFRALAPVIAEVLGRSRRWGW